MSKTPLFSTLRRASRQIRRTGLPTPVPRTLSRRDFLKGSAGLLGGLAIPRPLSMRQSGDARVVIVGAGLAGLTCSYRLQQAGIAAQVIEASGRIGGRMHTLRGFFPQDQQTELGGEVISTDHQAIIDLVGEMGLTLTEIAQDDGDLENERYYFGGELLTYDTIVEVLFPVVQAASEYDFDDEETLAELDTWSIEEWLDEQEMDDLAYDLLEVAAVTEFGLEIGEQSALNLMALIGSLRAAGDEFGAGDDGYHIREGNDALPTHLASALQRPVELETRLEAVTERGTGYRLTVNQGGRLRELDADIVVLALPFSLLRAVDLRVDLPPLKRRAIDELGYGSNTKLIAGFSERIWRASGSNGSSFSDLDYQLSWETRRYQTGTHGLLTSFTGGIRGIAVGQGTAEMQGNAFAAEIDAVFPGAADAYTSQAARAHWVSSPFALGSYACCMPGQCMTLLPAAAPRIGNLHFAGEHTSIDYQGYMNGACESGERAAREVIERLD